ncbi:MAG TPA: hypothetical protein VIA10_18510 [Gaiellaceae bacterium]
MHPPPHVLAAFGLETEPEPLPGGQGTAWRAGELVLKPVDTALEELEWLGRLVDSLDPVGFRVPRLRCVHDGWACWDRLAGEHRERAWPEVIAVGERFHAALADVPRPGFIARRTNHWAVGDRVAWGELPLTRFEHVKHLPRLAAALRPVATSGSQLVHGDLTGNVLFAAGVPPAVIDFSPYWRPPGYATAIVVGDALVWEGADETLLAEVAHVDDFPQFLLRALIFRAVVDSLFRAGRPHRQDAEDEFLPAVELACALAQ